MSQLEVGQKVSGKVANITKFGAFITLDTGETAMVHISEVASGYIAKIEDVLKVGDDVLAKIVSITPDGKISCSIKQALEQKANPVKQNRSAKIEQSKQNANFDDLMSAFLKDSSERLLDLKRNTEGKRGGRGGRRS